MTSINNYEYYEARAKDVKLTAITSDEYNADLLARLRDNVPVWDIWLTSSRCVSGNTNFVVREGDHLGWLGYFVGKGEKLKTLNIYNCFQENRNLHAFLEGLGHNRSVQVVHIDIALEESFQSLIPFLRNNDSLRDLNFHSFGTELKCARNIALLLGQQSSLKRIDFGVINLDDEGLVEIAAALKSQPQIEELRLTSNNIVRDGYVALGNVLECCLSLRELQLWTDFDREEEDNSDDWLDALVAGLKHCHNLTLLNLEGNQMNEGSRSLSTLLQSDNCRLEHLHLGYMDINDDGMTALLAGLTSLPSLKRFDLSGNLIGDQCLQAVLGALTSCNLEELDLSSNMLMDSVSGLRALGTLVRRTTSMQSLGLCNSSLTDEGLQSFIEGVANCCSLTNLDLTANNLITANGLSSLMSLFRAEHCSLSELSLFGINIGDDDAAVLANGLRGNKSLTTLRINASDITARGWAAFSRLLCDASSVNNTYLSNHTLAQIEFRIDGDIRCFPPDGDVAQYLKWNKSHNQAAAMYKILDNHPDIDFGPLFQWKMKCLPLVVAWLEGAWLCNVNESTEVFQCRQLSTVYKFVRSMPQLTVDGYRREKKTKDIQSDAKKKRKFDLTL